MTMTENTKIETIPGEDPGFGAIPLFWGTIFIGAIIAMIIVALVIMTETTGDIVAVGEIVDEKITPQRLADGMRADGAGTVLGGIFNTFPYTAFAQNVGLVALTGIKSRFAVAAGGAILLLLTFMIVFMNFLSDILLAWLDPRIKLGA